MLNEVLAMKVDSSNSLYTIIRLSVLFVFLWWYYGLDRFVMSSLCHLWWTLKIVSEDTSFSIMIRKHHFVFYLKYFGMSFHNIFGIFCSKINSMLSDNLYLFILILMRPFTTQNLRNYSLRNHQCDFCGFNVTT